MTPSRQYNYQPSKWKMLGLLLLVSAGAIFVAYIACTTEKPHERVLLGLVAVASPIGVFGIGCSVYLSFCEGRRVAINPHGVFVPSEKRWGLSGDEVQIPWQTIQSVEKSPFVGKALVIRIRHADGVAQVYSNMFRRLDDFHAFYQDLVDSLPMPDATG